MVTRSHLAVRVQHDGGGFLCFHSAVRYRTHPLRCRLPHLSLYLGFGVSNAVMDDVFCFFESGDMLC